MAERRSIRSLIGGWAVYWAVVAAVKLGPAAAAIYRATQGPQGEGSFSLNFGNGGFTLNVIEHGVTTYTGTASLLAIATWAAVPPLIWWVAWAAMRRKETLEPVGPPR
jgi:hypothetical protein